MKPFAFMLVFALPLCGCATGGRLADAPDLPQIYGGLRIHIDDFPFGHTSFLDAGGDWSGLHKVPGLLFIWWLPADIILSTVFDTLLLPVTIPMRMNHEEPEAPHQSW